MKEQGGKKHKIRFPGQRVQVYPLSLISLPHQRGTGVVSGISTAEEYLPQCGRVGKSQPLHSISGRSCPFLSTALHSQGDDIVIGTVDPMGNALHRSPLLLLDILSPRVSYGINHSTFGDDAHMRPEKQVSHKPKVRRVSYEKEVTGLQEIEVEVVFFSQVRFHG